MDTVVIVYNDSIHNVNTYSEVFLRLVGKCNIIVFLNGVDAPEINFDKDKKIMRKLGVYGINVMTAEVKMEPDRILRQVLSLIKHTHPEGLVSIIYSTDKITDYNKFLDIDKPGLGLKNSQFGKFSIRKFKKVRDLFILPNPFDVVPIIDTKDIPEILQSRDLHSFYSYFIKGEVTESYVNSNELDSDRYHESYWELLINPKDFKKPIRTIIEKLIKTI